MKNKTDFELYSDESDEMGKKVVTTYRIYMN